LKLTSAIVFASQDPLEFESELETFLNNHSPNPFTLYPFIKNSAANIPEEAVPAFLISRAEGRIVGFAPLLFRRQFGLWVASFLLSYEFSPDFITEQKYSQHVVNQFCLLMKKRRCRLEMDLPAESLTLQFLQEACLQNGISLHISSSDLVKHHTVVQVSGSWDDFNKARGRHFRQKFRAIERDLKKIGENKITCLDSITVNGAGAEAVFEEILKIEKASWKENWRFNAQHSQDYDLTRLWQSLMNVKNNAGFGWSAYFLELNNKKIAYALMLQYNGRAYLAKSSYVDKYRSVHAGLYVVHRAIEASFGKGIEEIDFMTNLYTSRTWATACRPRITCVASNGVIPDLLRRSSNLVSVGMKVLENLLPHATNF
jgi:CelD/BcsL family acetyltransferase involved in cellulose biosynthesis